MELKQYADPIQFTVEVYQVRHFGHDCAMDIRRNGVFHLLLAQRGERPDSIAISRSDETGIGSLYVQH